MFLPIILNVSTFSCTYFQQLEGKLNKLENMILSSSPEAPEKANKLSKMAAVYDQRIAESTRKTTAVQKVRCQI